MVTKKAVGAPGVDSMLSYTLWVPNEHWGHTSPPGPPHCRGFLVRGLAQGSQRELRPQG